MTDLATTIHNIPPASVAQKLRGRYQWAAYQALAAAAGEWVTAEALARSTYGDEMTHWEPLKALKNIIGALRRKGVPVQTHCELYARAGSLTRYRLPLEWQRDQDDGATDGEP